MKIERKNYLFLNPPVGPYVHAIRYNGMLYLSGLTAYGSDSHLKAIEFQAQEIFDQIQKIAQSEGSGLDNIIKVTLFVTDMSRIKEVREVLFNVYGGNVPASSLIHIQGLFSEGLKIEVEAVIALPG